MVLGNPAAAAAAAAAAMMARGATGSSLEHMHHGQLAGPSTVGDPSALVGNHGLVGQQSSAADVNDLLQQILSITDSNLDEAQTR